MFGCAVKKFGLRALMLLAVNGPTATEGKAAGDFLRDLVLNKRVVIAGIKASDGMDRQEKFGRHLGSICLDFVNINNLLVSKGHAVYREY